MFTQVILDNEDATIWYHRDSQIIHHYFKKYLHGASFRAVLEAGASALEKEHAKKWLSDDRNAGALSPDDDKWAMEIWFPRVKRAGWKHWAIVKPDKAVGVLNLQRFKETYAKAGVNAQFFANVDEAMTWLKRQ